MKVVLVNPNSHSSCSGGVGHPIGLLSVAGSLEAMGVDVNVVDANVLGFSVDKLCSYLWCLRYDVVGFSVNTLTINYALEAACQIKKYCKNVRVVLGGVHATLFAEDLIKLPYVDAVVKGEGELTVLKALEVDGVHEEVKPNLNCVFPPSWKLLDLDLYRNSLCDGRFAMMMTSRGCPFNCNFCSGHIMCGKKVRYRPMETLREELETLRELNVRWLILQDDTFTLSREHVFGWCDLMLQSEHPFKWWCNSRVDTIDFEMLKYMKAAGCVGVCFGIESGNQTILDGMGKGLTLAQIRRGVELAKSAGLKTYGYFMLGNLDDTEETINETISFSKCLPLDFAQFSIATPFPKTRLWDIAVERGIIHEPIDWNVFDWEGNPPNVSLVSDEVRAKLYRKAIRSFYFRPKMIVKNLGWKNVKAGLRLLKK